MIDAKPEPIRSQKDGLILETGVAWWEPVKVRHRVRHHFIIWTFWPFALIAMMGAAYYLIERDSLLWLKPGATTLWVSIAYTVFAILVLFPVIKATRRWTDDRVSVRFMHTNGDIEVTPPSGWLQNITNIQPRYVVGLRKKAWDINSIEIVPARTIGGGHYFFDPNGEKRDGYPAYTVVLFFSDGSSYEATRNLDQEDARKVQTQLDAAWREACQAVAAHKPKPVPDHLLRELAKVPERGHPATPARGTVTEEDF